MRICSIVTLECSKLTRLSFCRNFFYLNIANALLYLTSMVTKRGPYLIEGIRCNQDCLVSIVSMFNYNGPEIVVIAWTEEDEAEGQVFKEGDDGTQSVLGVINDWNLITNCHGGKILKVLSLTKILFEAEDTITMYEKNVCTHLWYCKLCYNVSKT